MVCVGNILHLNSSGSPSIPSNSLYCGVLLNRQIARYVPGGFRHSSSRTWRLLNTFRSMAAESSLHGNANRCDEEEGEDLSQCSKKMDEDEEDAQRIDL